MTLKIPAKDPHADLKNIVPAVKTAIMDVDPKDKTGPEDCGTPWKRPVGGAAGVAGRCRENSGEGILPR